MLRKLTWNLIQSRGVKQLVNIKWTRPDYVPAYKPERSGDLESKPEIAKYSLPEKYALSEEIKDAPELVKRIFSVEHLGKKEYNNLIQKELMNRVRRHKYDDNTAETRIARITGHIRCLQETMEQYPKNVRAKQMVQELIDKRKKLLKFLRQYDYKKFEWLLEKLNIEYKAHPESFHKLSRKESLKKLTEMHCDEIRQKKLEDYKNLLESQQGPFLKEKLEALKLIRSEQIELKLQQNWTGHIMRTESGKKWTKDVMEWYPRHGKRKKGRQIKRWEDDLPKGWRRITRDRDKWKEMGEAYVERQPD